MAQRSRYWTPDTTYNIILKVGNVDLTPDLVSLRIITSIDLPYQTFILQLFYDPNSMILNEIYGQKPIKLIINLLATNRFPLETTIFELMYLESEMELEMQISAPQNVQKDRKPVIITAVPRAAYKTMNYYTNSTYLSKTLNEVISDLVSSTNATLRYDSEGRNNITIDQLLIPPNTLYKNLWYIDKTWGLFRGVPAIFCSYDNIVHIKNLSKKMNKNQKFTIYQLSLDQDNTEIIEKCTDGKSFYTTENIKTSYKGNSIVALLAPKQRAIVKPRDRLYYMFESTLTDIAKEYGVIAKNDKIYFDDLLSIESRISTISAVGYNLDNTFFITSVTQQLANVTDLGIRIAGSLHILNLMEVGEPIQVVSKITDKINILGKYILSTSEIAFDRVKTWETSASLHLIRTNRTLS